MAQDAPALYATNGEGWSVRMNVGLEKWFTFIEFENDESTNYYEYPSYWVTLYAYNNDAEKPTKIYYDLFWPCAAMADHYKDSDWFKGENFDWDRAAKEYGSLEAAQAPAPIATIAKIMETEGPAYVLPDGMVPPLYGCADIKNLNPCPHSCTYEGKTGYQLKPAKVTSGQVNYKEAAYLLIKSYDEESMTLDFTMYAPMGTPKSGDVKVEATVEETMSTTAPDFGFSPINVTPGEAHVFNLGAADAEYELGEGKTLGDCFENFKPAQMYCLAYCTAPYTFEGQYDATTLPASPKADGEAAAMDLSYVISYFTLEENETENAPSGIAEEEFYTADLYGKLTNTIEPGMIFPNYYLISSPDSKIVFSALKTTAVVYGWNNIPYPFEMTNSEDSRIYKIGLGDKNFGMNSHFVSNLGADVSVAFKGDLKYHYDATDYMKVKECPAVGTADASTLAVEEIAADGNAPVIGREYYNFQGIRLNEAPQKGLYMVREMKADGTVSVKKIAR